MKPFVVENVTESSCCCCNSLKSEFLVRKFGFSTVDEDLSWVYQFGDSAFLTERFTYVIWRLFLASAMLVGFGLELSDNIFNGVERWFPIYLTNWALFFETCYLIVAFFIALWILVKSPQPSSAQPWPTKLAWFLRSIGQPAAVVVTVAFWAAVYTAHLTIVTLWIHAINTIIVALDIFTSCYEVRILHYAYILAFGTAYVIWTIIHYRLDIGVGQPSSQRFIYSVLDWSSDRLTIVSLSSPVPYFST